MVRFLQHSLLALLPFTAIADSGALRSPLTRNDEENDRELQTSGCSKVITDVIVVGAGMAGLAAAARLEEVDTSIRYVILESSSGVGGRMRKAEMGVPGNRWSIEDGANWIRDKKDNPIMELAQAEGLEMTYQDWEDWSIYDETGASVNMKTVYDVMEDLDNAWLGVSSEAEQLYSSIPLSTDSVVKSLAENGWSVPADASGNLPFILQWWYLDYEFASADTSMHSFTSQEYDAYFVTDQRGFAYIAEQFFDKNIKPESLVTDTRVSIIDYDYKAFDPKLKARVITENANGCVEYIGSRIISTVSNGVMASEDLKFDPPLPYPNPFEQKLYIKVFYQFANKFWDDTEFVDTIRDEQHRGECHHWQSLDDRGFMSGSNILMCTLTTEAFETLVDPVTGDLSNTTLDSLLDPLRTVYGSDKVGAAVDTYYPKLNKDRDFGYGAFSNWQVGKTFDDYAKFFGGVEVLTPYCQHNGCNRDGEWILHISGTCSCMEDWEYVDGAFNGGQRSANHVLASLGYDVDTTSSCDAAFEAFAT